MSIARHPAWIAYRLNDRIVLAGGIAAPDAGLSRYDPQGPERYASASLAESLFVTMAFGGSYRVSKTLRVGATVQNVVSKIASRVTLSGCPAQTICAPEDPEFDADTKLTQLALFAPAASAGVQWDVLPLVTLGAMAQTPTRITNQCRSRARDRAPVLRAREARSTSGTRGALARGRPRRGSHVHDRVPQLTPLRDQPSEI